MRGTGHQSASAEQLHCASLIYVYIIISSISFPFLPYSVFIAALLFTFFFFFTTLPHPTGRAGRMNEWLHGAELTARLNNTEALRKALAKLDQF